MYTIGILPCLKSRQDACTYGTLMVSCSLVSVFLGLTPEVDQDSSALSVAGRRGTGARERLLLSVGAVAVNSFVVSLRRKPTSLHYCVRDRKEVNPQEMLF
ncbi:hypothetical protein Krac_0133 [Ktedonobacter racemifer DSM 44963]|uniref:Uncharacterized protein n=1 Tax=Ktedonobacter racemifer DSM 44963 TaxID=485913 RepID=D6U8U5_KTERA|nr:hypothetical protein Krac_0133 [Ktedonobacter racemifer DSM 44963]